MVDATASANEFIYWFIDQLNDKSTIFSVPVCHVLYILLFSMTANASKY